MHSSQRIIVPTADGSHTISIPDQYLTYHSHHGAIQESRHVYLQAGLAPILQSFPQQDIRVFELGFGTGLNAFLTALEADQQQCSIHYTTLEPYPLTPSETRLLNYPEQLGHAPLFEALHAAEWDIDTILSPCFTLHKKMITLQHYQPAAPVHLIYYDAFGPLTQPELWTEHAFRPLHDMLVPGGSLVTYCSKSEVRRAMQAAGLTVKKVPGPYGKRDMVIATRATNL